MSSEHYVAICQYVHRRDVSVEHLLLQCLSIVFFTKAHIYPPCHISDKIQLPINMNRFYGATLYLSILSRSLTSCLNHSKKRGLRLRFPN